MITTATRIQTTTSSRSSTREDQDTLVVVVGRAKKDHTAVSIKEAKTSTNSRNNPTTLRKSSTLSKGNTTKARVTRNLSKNTSSSMTTRNRRVRNLIRGNSLLVESHRAQGMRTLLQSRPKSTSFPTSSEFPSTNRSFRA